MNDLTNSFKFNNNHAFEGFNKQENQKSDSDKDSLPNESDEEVIDNSPAPEIINTKERKVLTNWLDAEYSSAFQYKKVKVNYSPYKTSPLNNKEINEIDIDIDDPIVVYEYLKKYTNVLYDYDCDKETEKTIVNILEMELKDYFHKNSAAGLEKYLDEKFRELKEKYLVIKRDEIPAEKISKMLFVKEL